MCELLGICANLPVTATLSLDVLARHGGDTGPHKDGWGIGYYQGAAIRLMKEAEAAAGSAWLRFIRDHELQSPIILSHIRKATRGARTLANTQPFQRELGGRMHLFAHNGNLAGIDDLALAGANRFRPVGETDSEIAFCELMRRLAVLWDGADGVPALERRHEVIAAFAAEIAPMGPANFLYADGDALFAHGNRCTQAGSGEIGRALAAFGGRRGSLPAGGCVGGLLGDQAGEPEAFAHFLVDQLRRLVVGRRFTGFLPAFADGAQDFHAAIEGGVTPVADFLDGPPAAAAADRLFVVQLTDADAGGYKSFRHVLSLAWDKTWGTNIDSTRGKRGTARLDENDDRVAREVLFDDVACVVDHLRVLRTGDRENAVAVGVGEGHEVMQPVFGQKSRIHVCSCSFSLVVKRKGGQ
jgi:predicted glutamine amidotransferase